MKIDLTQSNGAFFKKDILGSSIKLKDNNTEFFNISKDKAQFRSKAQFFEDLLVPVKLNEETYTVEASTNQVSLIEIFNKIIDSCTLKFIIISKFVSNNKYAISEKVYPAKPNQIYLVKNPASTEEEDMYDEYVYIQDRDCFERLSRSIQADSSVINSTVNQTTNVTTNQKFVAEIKSLICIPGVEYTIKGDGEIRIRVETTDGSATLILVVNDGKIFEARTDNDVKAFKELEETSDGIKLVLNKGNSLKYITQPMFDELTIESSVDPSEWLIIRGE